MTLRAARNPEVLQVRRGDQGGYEPEEASQQGELQVVSCESRLEEGAGTWAHGSAIEWLDTVVDPAAALLEVGGDTRLIAALVEGLYESLFGLRAR